MHPLEKIYPPGNPKLCYWWWFTGLHLLCWTLLLTIHQLIQPPIAYLLHCSPIRRIWTIVGGKLRHQSIWFGHSWREPRSLDHRAIIGSIVICL